MATSRRKRRAAAAGSGCPCDDEGHLKPRRLRLKANANAIGIPDPPLNQKSFRGPYRGSYRGPYRGPSRAHPGPALGTNLRPPRKQVIPDRAPIGPLWGSHRATSRAPIGAPIGSLWGPLQGSPRIWNGNRWGRTGRKSCSGFLFPGPQGRAGSLISISTGGPWEGSTPPILFRWGCHNGPHWASLGSTGVEAYSAPPPGGGKGK